MSATLVCIDRSCMSSDLMLNNPVVIEIQHFYNSVSYTNTSQESRNRGSWWRGETFLPFIFSGPGSPNNELIQLGC